MDKSLITAGGKITCLQCKANSKRSGGQCKKPALKNKLVCEFHGGRSTGPKTVEGKARISKVHLVHGRETLQKRVERQAMSVRLRQLEDIMHVLDMTTGGRWRGAKPIGYKPIRTLDEVKQFVLDNPLHPNKVATGQDENNSPKTS